MTKSQLLSAIGSKYDYVANEREVTNNEHNQVGIKAYAVSVWDIENGAIRNNEVRFFTNADGSEAWWFGSEPKQTPGVSFTNKVIEYLEGIPAIDAYVIEGETGNHARVRAMVGGVEKIGYVSEVGGVMSHILAS